MGKEDKKETKMFREFTIFSCQFYGKHFHISKVNYFIFIIIQYLGALWILLGEWQNRVPIHSSSRSPDVNCDAVVKTKK